MDFDPDPQSSFSRYARFLESEEETDDFVAWEELPEVEAEGACFIDARNGFNALFRYPMLWNVRHRWPKGSRFAFNCYRHSNIVIFRRGNGKKAHILLSEEGVSQGDPLAMVLYGVALLPLAEQLRRDVPEVTTPQFADDLA